MNETDFWTAARAKLRAPGDRLDRVENAVQAGMPDVNGCLEGTDFWMELKCPHVPKRAESPLMGGRSHEFLETQIAWFARQRKAGGIAWALIRAGDIVMLVRATSHYDGLNLYTFKEMQDAADISFPVRKPNWDILRSIIIHKGIERWAEAQRKAVGNVPSKTSSSASRRPVPRSR
jgi:hypothetical protein